MRQQHNPDVLRPTFPQKNIKAGVKDLYNP